MVLLPETDSRYGNRAVYAAVVLSLAPPHFAIEIVSLDKRCCYANERSRDERRGESLQLAEIFFIVWLLFEMPFK